MTKNANIIAQLEQIEGTRWEPMPEPTSEQDLAALEQAYGYPFTDDFRRIYRRFGGGELGGRDDAVLVLEHIETIRHHSSDPVLRERLPGAIVIAADAGANLFFYDAEDRLGRGRFAVFMNGRGMPNYASAVYVGATISEVIEKTLTIGNLDED